VTLYVTSHIVVPNFSSAKYVDAGVTLRHDGYDYDYYFTPFDI